MTPQELADIHARAFREDRPWTAAEFASLLDSPGVTLHAAGTGFAVSRSVAEESELLTLAVDPTYRRRGTGRALVDAWLDHAGRTAARAFLEVAADNTAALRLYEAAGFTEMARRRGYYAHGRRSPVDALILSRALTPGHAADSPAPRPESG